MLAKLLPIFCGALITISISISGWTMKEVVDLRTRVAVLESSRVTPLDIKEVWMEIQNVKMDIIHNGEKISNLPNSAPPQWFQDNIKAMESRLTMRMDKVEEKIDRIPKR